MPAVKMFITKFGREVLIDDEHPLAVAEREAAPEPDRKQAGDGRAQQSQASQNQSQKRQGR